MSCKNDLINNYLTQYLTYLEVQKNYSSYTITNYQEDIQFLLKFCRNKEIKFLEITYPQAKEYLIYLYEHEKEKATTVSRKISSIRSFFHYLNSQNITTNSAFDLLKLPKKEKKLPRYLEYNELLSLFEVPDINTPLGARDRLILELLYA
ncbi:MAG: site-specific integrase, partial [bacterium]|nr:site-specific integrase [bacterium]